LVLARFEAFVFDLDGTLFRLPVDWASARARLKELFQAGDEFAPIFGTLQKQLAIRPGLRGRAFAAIDELEVDAVKKADPVPGSLDLLRRLSGAAPLALVTMQGRRACDAVMERFVLAGVFGCSVTREDSLERSEQIGTALRGLGSHAKGALFVGDRLNDVVAARKAGVKVAILGRRIQGGTQPDHCFLSFDEFATFLFS
jgi:phosphoglycolate phosphatase